MDLFELIDALETAAYETAHAARLTYDAIDDLAVCDRDAGNAAAFVADIADRRARDNLRLALRAIGHIRERMLA